MKKIEAFIRVEKLDSVLAALQQTGYPGISISDVRGHGKQRGAKKDWHGLYEPPIFQAKMRLELIVRDEDLNTILKAISDAARTASFGDGKIFVSEIADAVRIRTNQRGEVALD